MPFVHPHRVELQEVDAAGVVFYAQFLVIAHRAYEAAFAALGCDLAGLLAEGRWALPMVHVEADYRRPLRHGDRIAVEVRCARAGGKSFTLAFTLRPVDGGEPHATVTHVHACLDRASGTSAELPETVRAALTRLG